MHSYLYHTVILLTAVTIKTRGLQNASDEQQCVMRFSDHHCWRFKPSFYELQGALYPALYRNATCPEIPLWKLKMQHCDHKNPLQPAKSRSFIHNLFSKILLYLLITLKLNTWLPYFRKIIISLVSNCSGFPSNKIISETQKNWLYSYSVVGLWHNNTLC